MSDFLKELQIFWNDLIFLLKQDWENFKKYYNENKRILLYILISFLSIQTIGILNIAPVLEKNCNTLLIGGNIELSKNKKTDTIQKKIGKNDEKTFADNIIDETKKTAKKKIFDSIKKIELGPLLSRFSMLNDVIMGALAIIGVILAIIGIISLPFLFIIISVYSTIKLITSYFMDL